MKTASFEIDLTQDDIKKFADLSGDWNPLHTDADYASSTIYKHPIAHGAFSAGLMSRLAGMYLPGEACLLHSMRMRFIRPIFLPTKVRIQGKIISETEDAGIVEVVISDAVSAVQYVDGRYEFGYHKQKVDVLEFPVSSFPQNEIVSSSSPTLISGGSGGIGKALKDCLGRTAHEISWSSSERKDFDRSELPTSINAIVHCGWPMLDNQKLLDLDDQTDVAVQHHISRPIEQIISLAQLLRELGEEGASLILIGSTAAEPGRHAYSSPLYGIAKSTIPQLVRVLGLELAEKNMTCIGVNLDVIDGPGMNAGMTDVSRLRHQGRTPSGQLPTPEDIALNVKWILDNKSHLLSGGMISLTGGALP